MKILVLGGAGYIGSHTVYRLIEQGHKVVVFDNFETGYYEAIHPDAEVYEGDLRNRADIDNVFDEESDIDAVIHFAANSLVGESMVKPLKYYDNNICGTKVLLESINNTYYQCLIYKANCSCRLAHGNAVRFRLVRLFSNL